MNRFVRSFGYFTVLLIALATFIAPANMAHADEAGTAYEKVRAEYYRLQRSDSLQKYRDNWLKVIKGFVDVSETYPGHKKGGDALYMAGRVSRDLSAHSYSKGDKKQAIFYFDQLVESYPSNSLADDALFLAGGLFESMDDKIGAYIRYQRVVVEYPGGDMAGRANNQLADLKLPAPSQTTSATVSESSAVLSAPNVQPKPPAVQMTVPASQSTSIAVPSVSVVQPSAATANTATPSATKSTVQTSGTAIITGIRYWSNPDYTRVVIDLDQKAAYKPVFLPGDSKNKLPGRLFVDVEGAEILAAIPNPLVISDGLLQRVRLGKPVPSTARVVIDLESIDRYNVFSLSSPYRIVFDIFGKRQSEMKAAPPVPVTLTGSTTVPAEIPTALVFGDGDGDGDGIADLLGDAEPTGKAEQRVIKGGAGTSIRRIVVDAGHGGKDPGAVGKKKTLEKDIVLQMAKLLAKELERELGCEVVMTRDRDVFIPLEERTAIANKVGADLFISLHANASTSRKVYGVETFYLNFSKNEKAMAVVARENDTSLKEVGDLDLILFDLMANSKINESSRLAAEIQKSLVSELSGSYSKIRNLGVKQGPFYVLLGATMPSVLVETAFLSNAREEDRLKSTKFQKTAVKGIVKAVKKYRDTIDRVAN